jgi:putative redox protein
VEVAYLGGESYAVAARGHALLTDQPTTTGGEDTAMGPVELLVTSLSSCVIFCAGRYRARHGLNRDGLHVTAEFGLAADRPARVGKIQLKIRVPGACHPDAGRPCSPWHHTAPRTTRSGRHPASLSS